MYTQVSDAWKKIIIAKHGGICHLIWNIHVPCAKFPYIFQAITSMWYRFGYILSLHTGNSLVWLLFWEYFESLFIINQQWRPIYILPQALSWHICVNHAKKFIIIKSFCFGGSMPLYSLVLAFSVKQHYALRREASIPRA